jgi:hypothetical protein
MRYSPSLLDFTDGLKLKVLDCRSDLDLVGISDHMGAAILEFGSDVRVSEVGSGRVHDNGDVTTSSSGMNGSAIDSRSVYMPIGVRTGCVRCHDKSKSR